MKNEDVLEHHGILGMKWGVHRSEAELARSRGHTESDSGQTGKTKVATSKHPPAKKASKRMSDDELRAQISRLELEKRYSDLLRDTTPAQKKKGRDFVMGILEQSGKNIGGQLATYAMGTAVNKMAGSQIVNPKKGQKDK